MIYSWRSGTEDRSYRRNNGRLRRWERGYIGDTDVDPTHKQIIISEIYTVCKQTPIISCYPQGSGPKTVSGGLGCTSTPDFDLLSLQTLFFFYKKKDIPLLILIPLIFKLKPLKPSTKNSKISKMGVLKRRVSSSRGLGGVLREQRAKLYIIKRCVVMLLCWQD
ncbi:hypothetical protein YC2023_107321 [Brassica napus]